MSKDQAARIAADVFQGNTVTDDNDRAVLAKVIRRAITTAVRKERERCVGIVKKRFDNKWNARTLDLAGIESEIKNVAKINGGKR